MEFLIFTAKFENNENTGSVAQREGPKFSFALNIIFVNKGHMQNFQNPRTTPQKQIKEKERRSGGNKNNDMNTGH